MLGKGCSCGFDSGRKLQMGLVGWSLRMGWEKIEKQKLHKKKAKTKYIYKIS